MSSPGKSYLLSSSRTSISTSSRSSSSSTRSHLVQEDDDVRHADLTGEQHVLARLGHRAVRRGDHEDRAVHLGGAGDHVLHVVGVARAVDVRVVTGSVSYSWWCRRVDGHRLGRVTDVPPLVISAYDFSLATVLDRRLTHRDRRGQRRLAVVDVTDRADVDVRLGSLEGALGHFSKTSIASMRRSPPRCAEGRTAGLYYRF